MENFNKVIRLDVFISKNVISLDRGRVISSIDLNTKPGNYPVYSSSSQNNGLFGAFDEFDFDEELITWSVDGGGYFFYRPKHKFSVTNVSGILRILDKSKLDYKFLYYLLDFQHRNQLYDYVDKAHPSVIKKRYFIPEIEIVEQKKIADIFSKVDKAISETEIIIAKYNRIKTGLMQDLLTKGIDEKGNIRSEETHEFKDSPFGRISKEWKVDTLKNLCNSDITYGIVQAGPNIENGIPYIRTGDMSGDRLLIDNLLRTNRKIAERFERSRVLKGDIVFALRATIGKVLLVPEELNGANLTQGTARISANENKVKNEFLLYCLRMQYFKTQILENQKGTTFFEISLSHLRNMKVFYPESLDEQNKIIDALNDVENSIDIYKKELSKLKSIKTGLMQDLLSGKKRVTHLIN